MKSSITIMNPTTATEFRRLILRWFDQHGRKHLPWQQNKTPYRVWISEIMLQQTQVATVIPYYERFMASFPTIAALANASADAVMQHWAGLGYYSRARHIHRAAKIVVNELEGKFPDSLEGLMALPGIGRSTAGAILAIAYQQRATILDGNVKRVLARFACVTTPIDDKKTENLLWTIADNYAPSKRIDDYTQAMMDLGATICLRSKPRCEHCPLQNRCLGLKAGIASQLPQKKIAKQIPTRTATFLILHNKREILLEKRPDHGIWGGLWSLPELSGLISPEDIKTYCQTMLRLRIKASQPLPAFRHTFSHYHLDIHPILVTIDKKATRVMEEDQQIWYNLNQPDSVGLPAPVKQILKGLANEINSLLEIK